MKTTILAAAFAALAPFATLADEAAISATAPYAFETGASAKAGGVYVHIMNSGEADALVGVKSDIAARTEVHESREVEGVMKMQHVDALPLPANGEIMMQPGGYHIMLMGLKAPLTEGESFPVTLVFESGTEITVNAEVKKRGEEGMDHSGHKMSN